MSGFFVGAFVPGFWVGDFVEGFCVGGIRVGLLVSLLGFTVGVNVITTGEFVFCMTGASVRVGEFVESILS